MQNVLSYIPWSFSFSIFLVGMINCDIFLAFNFFSLQHKNQKFAHLKKKKFKKLKEKINSYSNSQCVLFIR